jgi:hypothetical protein
MPVQKRYFHCSQDLLNDPEIWSLMKEFGDRSILTWLQILIYLERSNNQWRLVGDWLAVLSRQVRQSPANLSRQVGHLVGKGWLTVGEVAADGSPLVLNGSNWLKYNKTRVTQKDLLNTDQGINKHPLLTVPYHTVPNLPIPPSTERANGRSLDEFEIFWKEYPRKIGKKKALKAWIAAKDKPALADILKSVQVAKLTEQWKKDGGKYIPHPSTWLNEGRWDDEVKGGTVIDWDKFRTAHKEQA